MNKKWEYYEPNEEKIKEIAKENNVSELFAKILVNREITEEKQRETFLNPTRNDFYDPFLMPDVNGGNALVKYTKMFSLIIA